MKEMHDDIKLTSSEIAMLWQNYSNDTLGICMMSYFLHHIENSSIRSMLEYSLELSQQHVNYLDDLFKKEDYPIPIAFRENDVNKEAGKLFSDTFVLFYLQGMGATSMNAYTMALRNAARKDIRIYFTKCLESTAELYNRTSDVLQEKGLFVRSPALPYPEKVEFVEKQHFLAGWIGEQRPLTMVEILFLFSNFYRNAQGKVLLEGFSQVAHSKEVRKYMKRGAEIAKHHCKVFAKFLEENDVIVPMSWDLNITNSTESPFSDKLMMFHTTALNNVGMDYYGRSMGGSPRRDLAAAYVRLMIEVGEYGEDGMNMMIEQKWMEQPPSVPNRKK